jgi:hypothetical protein
MSAWRVMVKRLHELGGAARRSKFDTFTDLSRASSGLYMAERLGLVRHEGRGPAAIWHLTPLGQAYCEGRAEERFKPQAKTGGRAPIVIAATWLMSYPGVM